MKSEAKYKCLITSSTSVYSEACKPIDDDRVYWGRYVYESVRIFSIEQLIAKGISTPENSFGHHDFRVDEHCCYHERQDIGKTFSKYYVNEMGWLIELAAAEIFDFMKKHYPQFVVSFYDNYVEIEIYDGRRE